MRPIVILAVAEAGLLLLGASTVPLYAASPQPDGVTVVPDSALPTAAPAVPKTATVQLDNGDTVTAAAGAMIVIQRDPSDGTYSIGVAAPK
jgi:hypothetical protein